MSSEFKWALFSLTNERIRNSGNVSGINLKKIMFKLTGQEWDTGGRLFDITKNYFGEDIHLSEFGKRIFFRATDQYEEGVIPGHHYEVKNLQSTNVPNEYTVTLVEIDPETGVIIGNDI